ncbi:MAG: hypothetical protein U5L11_09360 [Arhodomonas sp.]|nr:hypothetical protein [Arhodomonas sp.]
METLSRVSTGLHPEDLGSYRGHPSDSICWDYDDPDAIPGVVGGCRFSPATAEAGLGGPLAYARRLVPGWGRAHKEGMAAQFGHALAVGAIGESLPHPGTFVDLHPSQTDDHGVPLARIHQPPGRDGPAAADVYGRDLPADPGGCRGAGAGRGVRHL